MLQGIELIDCAKANAKQGSAVAADLCGYDQNVGLFIENLHKACEQIGVDINELEDLITDQQMAKEGKNIKDIAPETNSDL